MQLSYFSQNNSNSISSQLLTSPLTHDNRMLAYSNENYIQCHIPNNISLYSLSHKENNLLEDPGVFRKSSDSSFEPYNLYKDPGVFRKSSDFRLETYNLYKDPGVFRKSSDFSFEPYNLYKDPGVFRISSDFSFEPDLISIKEKNFDEDSGVFSTNLSFNNISPGESPQQNNSDDFLNNHNNNFNQHNDLNDSQLLYNQQDKFNYISDFLYQDGFNNQNSNLHLNLEEYENISDFRNNQAEFPNSHRFNISENGDIPNFEKKTSDDTEKSQYYSPEIIINDIAKKKFKDKNCPIKYGEKVKELDDYVTKKREGRPRNVTDRELKRGRIAKEDKNNGLTGEHDKYKENNLTIKFKAHEMSGCRDWINSLEGGNEPLKKIDNKKYVKNINVRENIEFNELEFCKIFSDNKEGKNYNQRIIQKNIESKTEKGEALKMKRHQFHLIQLYQETDETRNKYSEKLINSVPKIDDLIRKIYDKEVNIKKKENNRELTEEEIDEIKEYMFCLLYVAYNMDYILYNKQQRKKRSKKGQKKD